MDASEFLRQQATNCLRLARECFDLATATRLRLMAADLQTKAAEFEHRLTVLNHTGGNNPRSSSQDSLSHD
jgi:hypothetical protein